MNEEYDPIVKDVLTTPKYLKEFLVFSAKETFLQLKAFRVEQLTPQVEGSPIIVNIGWRFKDDYDAYKSADQAKETLGFFVVTAIQNVVVIGSLIFLAIVLIYRRWRQMLPKVLVPMITLCIAAMIFNAAICASLSMVGDRFQARIIWIIPMLAVLAGWFVVSRGRRVRS